MTNYLDIFQVMLDKAILVKMLFQEQVTLAREVEPV